MQEKNVALSVVLPVYNEQECIVSTLRELYPILDQTELPWEVIAVDDGSKDNTNSILREEMKREPRVRLLELTPNSGQSAALGVGFAAVRGTLVITMDADGQNNPADIPRLLQELKQCDVCCGYRVNRRDSFAKRLGSRIANSVRNSVLREEIRDTGCTLKAFHSEFLRELPMFLKGTHRFLPALVCMKGATIRQIPVHHRARVAGASKYTNLGRLKETIWDLLAVRWMQRRTKRYVCKEVL